MTKLDAAAPSTKVLPMSVLPSSTPPMTVQNLSQVVVSSELMGLALGPIGSSPWIDWGLCRHQPN